MVSDILSGEKGGNFEPVIYKEID